MFEDLSMLNNNYKYHTVNTLIDSDLILPSRLRAILVVLVTNLELAYIDYPISELTSLLIDLVWFRCTRIQV